MKTSAGLFTFVAAALGASRCVETMAGYAPGACSVQDQAAPAAAAPELLEFMKARKETLSKRLEYVKAQAQFQKRDGTPGTETLYAAIRQLKEADLDLSTTEEERIAALEANLQRLQDLEKEAKIRADLWKRRPKIGENPEHCLNQITC